MAQMNINVGVLLRMKSEMVMGIRSLSASTIKIVSPPLVTSTLYFTAFLSK